MVVEGMLNGTVCKIRVKHIALCLPKLEVAGSNPIARSKKTEQLQYLPFACGSCLKISGC